MIYDDFELWLMALLIVLVTFALTLLKIRKFVKEKIKYANDYYKSNFKR